MSDSPQSAKPRDVYGSDIVPLYEPIPEGHECLMAPFSTTNGFFYERVMDFLCDKENGLLLFENFGHQFTVPKPGANLSTIDFTCICGLTVSLYRWDCGDVPPFAGNYAWWFPPYGKPRRCTCFQIENYLPLGYVTALQLCNMRLFDSRFGPVFNQQEHQGVDLSLLQKPDYRRFFPVDKDVLAQDFFCLIGEGNSSAEFRSQFSRQYLLRKRFSHRWHQYLNLQPHHCRKYKTEAANAREYRLQQFRGMRKYRARARQWLVLVYATRESLPFSFYLDASPYSPALDDMVIDTPLCAQHNATMDQQRKRSARSFLLRANSGIQCPSCPVIRDDVPLPCRITNDQPIRFTPDPREEPQRWPKIRVSLERYFRPRSQLPKKTD